MVAIYMQHIKRSNDLTWRFVCSYIKSIQVTSKQNNGSGWLGRGGGGGGEGGQHYFCLCVSVVASTQKVRHSSYVLSACTRR